MAAPDSFDGDETIGSSPVASAVRLFRSLGAALDAVDLSACEPDDLVELVAGIRHGQAALDRVMVLVALVSEQHLLESKGRGIVGTLLDDGRHVKGRTAHREAERARTVSKFRRLELAVHAGLVGAAQIDAISAVIRGLSDDDQQSLVGDGLIKAASSLPADVFAKHVRREAERIKADNGLGDTKRRQARSSWKHWFDERTGMGHVHGEFDPERYEAIIGSVEAELTRLANEGGVSKDCHLAAEAAYGLLTEQRRQSGSGRPRISVVVDWETFSRGAHDGSVRETADGHPLPPESLSRLACDATVQRIVLDIHGVPVNVGRRYRTATDAQWQAVRAIYRTCAWHGCERPVSWCQMHHIHEWEHGGSTDLSNLIPLCSRHHHAVHEGGWSVKLHADTRRLDIFSPDGRHHTTTWPDRAATPSPLRRNPAAAMAP